MVIGIDLRSFGSCTGGIPTYAEQLLRALLRISPPDVHYVVMTSGAKPLHFPFENSRVAHIHVRVPNRLLNASIRLFRRPRIDRIMTTAAKRSIDVLFAPNLNFLAWSSDVPIVLTFHDLSFRIFPHFLSWRQKLWHANVLPASLCARSAHIISVSYHTQRDVQRAYHVFEKNMRVIPLAAHESCSKGLSHESLQLLDLPQHYVLVIGATELRKNASYAITVFNKFVMLHDLQGTYHLVLSGYASSPPAWLKRLIAHSAASSRIHYVGPLSRADHTYLVSRASVLLYASFYEGFGLPIIDAHVARIPVICSANSSMAEYFGSSAVLIDPYNYESGAWALAHLLHDESLREFLKEKAYARAQEFSWDATAEQTLQVCASVAARHITTTVL